MVKLSDRLMAAASMVSEGMVLADVGTDHGYIPIYLVEQKKILKAIAMDINEGPLERAREHITLYGLDAYIQTRLSDGVAALKPGEADAVLIAGMGGGLVMHILKDGEEVCKEARELILQPQSELERVRAFLRDEGYEILTEDMVLDDDQFYPMMKAHYVGKNIDNHSGIDEPEQRKEASLGKLQIMLMAQMDLSTEQNVDVWKLCDLYGGLLLQNRHPVLKTYLEKEKKLFKQIEGNLKKQAKSEKIQARLAEVKETLKYNTAALRYMDKME